MITAVQPYIDLIMRERSWSWAVVCLLYILAALFVRGWFTSPVTSQLKSLDKKRSHQLKSAYLKNAFVGWVLFFLPLILIAAYWNKNLFPLPILETWLMGLGFLCFILSVVLHLQAFAMASMSVLESMDKDKLAEV